MTDNKKLRITPALIFLDSVSKETIPKLRHYIPLFGIRSYRKHLKGLSDETGNVRVNIEPYYDWQQSQTITTLAVTVSAITTAAAIYGL